MAANKHTDKGFCPFCGNEFLGDHDNCPFCGQDLRQYKDDLGPIMESIQTRTNIDMKSPKVRITTSIILFVLVFAGALVAFDYYETHMQPEPEPVAEGIIVDIKTNGYIDLTGDFASYDLNLLPTYDPELKLTISLSDKYQGKYNKIMWMVQTDAYNGTNAKNPFYQKVTKEITDSDNIYSVTWDNVSLGGFCITANCYGESGDYDVFIGKGVYYGKYTTTYSWEYDGTVNSFEYTMSSDEVKNCLNVDLSSRLDEQSKTSMTKYVVDSLSVETLNDQLRSLFNKNYRDSQAKYADFVLSFVQNCFPNVFDSFNYRVNDYWAYPTETLLWGCGDDEDRAILYCSIMKREGRDVGLLFLPETTIAAVDVDLTDSPISAYAKGVRGVYSLYIVADTSSELGLGELRPYYDVSDNGRILYYNGEEIHGRYGLEVV